MPRYLPTLGFLAAALAAQPIQIRVLDAHWAPIAGAQLECRPTGELSQTDLSGASRLECPPPGEIGVRAAGFEPETLFVTAPAQGPLTVILRPATVRTTLEVAVRQAPEAGPISGSRMEIDARGARTVLDAVEKLSPGAYVTRRGVMGYGIATNGTGVLTLRGVGGQPNTGVLIVIDGRPDYQGLMGHPLPDFYGLADAGSITVIEGPASVSYGSNAMGGVIEIRSAPPPERMQTRLTSSLGSYLTGQHRLSNGARWGRAYYAVAAGVSHTRGERERAAFRSQEGSVCAGYELSPSWKAAVRGRYGHFYVEDPGPVFAPLFGSFAGVGRGGGSLELDHSGQRTWGHLSVFSNHGRHVITDGFRSVDRTSGARLAQHAVLRSGLTLEIGSDVVNYGGRAQNVKTRLDYGAHELTSAAGFSRLNWSPGERFRLFGGLRYEWNSAAGDITAPEAGANLRLHANYWLTASVARGFRNPTIRELYLFPAPNPLLKREDLYNYELKLAARPRSDLEGAITAFYADAQNLIVTTGRFPNLRLENSGSAINRGFEATVRYRPGRRVRFSAGGLRMASTNLPAYVPRSKCNYALDLDLKRILLSWSGVGVGRTWVSAQRTRQLGGYHVASLKLTAPLRGNNSLFVLVDNVLDKRYQVVDGYPLPGVNAVGGFMLSF